jgi:glycosyltransferase involved in cell wall biosynthesis
VRRELGIADDALVLGHVGRFVQSKNHVFLIDVLDRLRDEPRIHLLLVGDGPLRQSTEDAVRRRALTDRVTFVGSRSDIPSLFAAMDLFLFPSLLEGLGLVLVEAQAAGVPSVCSTAIPPEALVIPSLVEKLPTHSADLWASRIRQRILTGLENMWPASIEQLEASEFDINRCVAALESLYTHPETAVRASASALAAGRT